MDINVILLGNTCHQENSETATLQINLNDLLAVICLEFDTHFINIFLPSNYTVSQEIMPLDV